MIFLKHRAANSPSIGLLTGRHAPQVTHMADLLGHEGPVWQVAWGHPKFGALLASASFDHRVIVWREGPDGAWSQVHHETSWLPNPR